MTARGAFRLYQVQDPSTRANAAVGYAHNRRHNGTQKVPADEVQCRMVYQQLLS
jgi:hypothetical protein